jgi:hypothetical protein
LISGRVGVPPAGSGVSPERTFICAKERDARCVARRAGCPPYPRTAAIAATLILKPLWTAFDLTNVRINRERKSRHRFCEFDQATVGPKFSVGNDFCQAIERKRIR